MQARTVHRGFPLYHEPVPDTVQLAGCLTKSRFNHDKCTVKREGFE